MTGADRPGPEVRTPPLTAWEPTALDAVPVDGTIEVEAIRPGDLMFCARPSPLQELCTRAGEPWRHVGLVALDGDRRVLAEVGGAVFSARPVEVVFEANEAVAVGRLDPRLVPAARRAAQWSHDRAGEHQAYAWDDVILSGFIAVTRLYARAEDRATVERAVYAAMSTLARRQPPEGTLSVTCSSFIALALREAGCRFEADLTTPRAPETRPTWLELVVGGPRPRRAGGGSHITSEQFRLLARALVRAVAAGWLPGTPTPSAETLGSTDQIRWVTPGDLWRWPAVVERFVVSR
ncbi:MAG: hypothetical protein ACK5RL_17430 [Acidimicrobiales bacterium]